MPFSGRRLHAARFPTEKLDASSELSGVALPGYCFVKVAGPLSIVTTVPPNEMRVVRFPLMSVSVSLKVPLEQFSCDRIAVATMCDVASCVAWGHRTHGLAHGGLKVVDRAAAELPQE